MRKSQDVFFNRIFILDNIKKIKTSRKFKGFKALKSNGGL